MNYRAYTGLQPFFSGSRRFHRARNLPHLGDLDPLKCRQKGSAAVNRAWSVGWQTESRHGLLALSRISTGAYPTTKATEYSRSMMLHTGNEHDSILCGLNASVE